jgi:hypothetical protein
MLPKGAASLYTMSTVTRIEHEPWSSRIVAVHFERRVPSP